MNLKGITAPLTEKMGDLTALVQEMSDNIKEQTILQKKILIILGDINERIHKEDTPETPKVAD